MRELRSEPRRFVDEFVALDVARLKRAGALAPGARAAFDARWRRGATVSVAIERRPGSLACRAGAVAVDVPLSWTPTRFGGARAWLNCPRCAARRRVLLVAPDGAIACRVCHGAVYRSQHLGPFDRAIERAIAVRARLGGEAALDTAFPDRPPRMRRRRYEAIAAAAERREAAIWAEMGMLQRKLVTRARAGRNGRPRRPSADGSLPGGGPRAAKVPESG